MTERSVATLRDIDQSRIWREATKGATFEARMRGIDVIGMDDQLRFIVVHSDGTTSQFPRA